MARKRKSWREKLHDSKDLPKVVEIPEKMKARVGEGTMVVPAPIEVDEIMRKVPKGKLITVAEIRSFLAKKHGATIGCPLTTGIFINIAANAAEESREAGETEMTPYWRTLKAKGELNPKFPGGVERHEQLLEAEGHTVIKRGKKYFVADYEAHLVSEDEILGR